MADDWIFNLLGDLRRFALANGLPALAAQIETTERVAAVELAARNDAGEADPMMGGQGGRPH